MNQFAQSNPTENSFWAETEDVSLLEAVSLSFGIEPFSMDEYLQDCGEPVRLRLLPDGFMNRIEALRSAIRAGKINTVMKSMNERGTLDEVRTRIPMDEFLAWCGEKGIAVSIPSLQRSVPPPESGASDQNVVATTQPPTDKPLSTKERETMLKLIIGMAIDAYKYDPTAPKSLLTGEGVDSLHANLSVHGISVDPDTIRKYLKEAKEHLPPQL